MKRTYRNPVSVLRAAKKRVGGYLVTYDGTPMLALDKLNSYGQVVTTYLHAHEAAELADLTYSPRNDEL